MARLPRFTVAMAVVDPHTEWTRRRLQLMLGAAVAVLLAVVAGAVWSLGGMLTSGSPTAPGAGAGDTDDAGRDGMSQSVRDQLADQPLPDAPVEAAQPGDLSSGETGMLRIPASRSVGPAAVATGFPRTPAGALSQLAAIDQAALSSASVRVAQEVITGWAAPGGPTPRSWSGVRAVAALLESAGMPADGSGAIAIGVEPMMGFVKATVGEGFVIPCIDFLLTATTTTGWRQQVAAADCQRMVWRTDGAGGRWVIGPGSEPAQPPSLWPGSRDSFDAGYQWLEVTS